MTEKEKSILDQELWALIAQNSCADKHSLEIMSKMLKCVAEDELDTVTPNKQKVIEELQLEWSFLKTIHEDLVKIAAKLNKSDVIPAIPDLQIQADLWDTETSGTSDELYKVNDKISLFQTELQECAFKLQEACE